MKARTAEAWGNWSNKQESPRVKLIAHKAVVLRKDQSIVDNCCISEDLKARNREFLKPIKVKLIRRGHNVYKEV